MSKFELDILRLSILRSEHLNVVVYCVYHTILVVTGRYEYYAKQQQCYTRSEKAADNEDPTYGATEGHGDSESARYRQQFWSAFGGGSDWGFGAKSRWETPHQARTPNPKSMNIGSSADRLVLGLSPAGPLSLEELKLA